MSKNSHSEIITTIIHISDLHFSKKIKSDENLYKKALNNMVSNVNSLFGHSFTATLSLSSTINSIVKKKIKNNIPVGIIFSGDLTRRGSSTEFEIGQIFLRKYHFVNKKVKLGLNLGKDKSIVNYKNSPALFSIPGNHDIFKRKNPSAMFNFFKWFPYQYPIEWQIKTHDNIIYLHGLNSLDTSNISQKLSKGFVQKQQLKKIVKRINEVRNQKNDSIHIVFLHHPITKIPHKITMKLENYFEVSKHLKGKADLVLSGHIHEEKIIKESSLCPHQIISGTATQQCSEKNFSRIDIYKNNFIIHQYKYDDKLNQFVEQKNQIKLSFNHS